MKTINWGIIGCGDVCEVKSGPGFQKAAHSSLVAVMRRDEEKARDYAKCHHVSKYYTDANQLINDPDVDAVYVATPPNTHLEYAAKVMRAGKPVYVEKPMAMNFAECMEMQKISEQTGQKLFVAFYRRALPYFLKVKELLDSEAIGKPLTVSVQYFRKPSETDIDPQKHIWRVKKNIAGGGYFFDLAPHTLDILDFLLGEIEDAQAFVGNLGHFYDVEDTISTVFRFRSGVQGMGQWSFVTSAAAERDTIEIIGTKGTLLFNTFAFEPIKLSIIENGKLKIENDNCSSIENGNWKIESGSNPSCNSQFSIFNFQLIDHPQHIQQPLIQSIVNELLGQGKCPSTGSNGTRTAWVMDKMFSTIENEKLKIESGNCPSGNSQFSILNSQLSIQDYDYNLQDERIAKFPLPQRDSSKLLIYNNNRISESIFRQLPDYVPEGALMVFNNTKVIMARLIFHKNTGARIEIFCLEPVEPKDYALAFGQTEQVVWLCMVGNLKKWKEKQLYKELNINDKKIKLSAELIENDGLTHRVKFSWDDASVTFSQILETTGELPIPPYLHRDACEKDKETYQTVYSKINGSVAAPTAGLHFTPDVFEALKSKNIKIAELTLHVGAGTFHPVKSERIEEHEMHTELLLVDKTMIESLLNNLGKIIAVGTTSVRTLESLYYIGWQIEQNPQMEMQDLKVSQWMPYEARTELSTEKALQNIADYLTEKQTDKLEIGTQIIIAPGFHFRIVSGIVTNFHQPKSTLLLLVSAFIGENWRNVYDYALGHDFRFLSYGDSSLLMK